MKLVIDRKRWARGDVDGGNKLLDGEGKMCCLGFFGLACGLTAEEINGYGEPFDAASAKWPKWLLDSELWDDGSPDDTGELVWLQSDECQALMNLNDSGDPARVDPEREAGIAEIFAKHGVEVEFVDG